ncbi:MULTISPECIES: hypothetical protein [Thalassospira]|uniref:Uncharacterized protein n=1 Tax=Thalassospira alkalitolerans TaxID=1293890 RepID=A0A1Y2LF74_9PROT|nr:hypothetical protein [Thalassospira alkalitolerans]OSQ49636.1 hypothetical protein TALK_04770 [Thalassospira alkalitolerans]
MPDPDKWKQIEETLKGVFGKIKVQADGYELTLTKSIDRERLVTLVHVNGEIKGKWFRAKNGKPLYPEARFWFPMRRRAWPIKKHSELKKAFGKREADQMTALETVCFSPMWTSPRSLIAHLKKHFPELEIVEDSNV